jgi:hypothetical protein
MDWCCVRPASQDTLFCKHSALQNVLRLSYPYTANVCQQTSVLVDVKDVEQKMLFLITITILPQSPHPRFQPLSSLLGIMLMAGSLGTDLE